MAEGWARNWIDDQISILRTTLQEFQDEDEDEDEGKGTFMKDDRWSRRIREHISILEKTIVASVALDSSAVFNASGLEDTSILTATTTISPRPAPEDNSFGKRKQVKSKAVEAMAKDGVDISLFKPKTIDEVMPVLGDDDEVLSVATIEPTTSIHISNPLLENILVDQLESDDIYPKTVDKLIVLCACGDALIYKLARRSKSVEEWSIDAPTTASKNGEGDSAYRRVSLEIKKEVKILMESLLGSPC